MEALLLVLNGGMMLVVIYMGLRDDRRPPGTRMLSPFRMTEGGTRIQDARAQDLQRRVAQSRGLDGVRRGGSGGRA